MTKTNSNKNVECKAQGIANFISGFIGGMGGCAMIGQAIINVRSGGRGRLSTLTSGVCLILLVFTLKDIMVQIPLAAFVAVMITVSIATFDWSTLKNIKKTPLSDLLVILVTVLLVVVTDNLAIGVIVGVVLEFILFTIKMSKIFISRSEETKNKVVYTVKGTLFFASCSGIMSIPEEVESYHHVKLDLSDCHIIDQTAVTSLKKTIHKLNKSGKKVEYIGFDASL